VKLLFDENLSPRLVGLLAAEYPGSAHVEQAIRRARTDTEVWHYAATNAYAIVSKVADVNRFGEATAEALLVLEL
jgi:predicted nuclease of predicted toxin-antitoxin system